MNQTPCRSGVASVGIEPGVGGYIVGWKCWPQARWILGPVAGWLRYCMPTLGISSSWVK